MGIFFMDELFVFALMFKNKYTVQNFKEFREFSDVNFLLSFSN